jgi:hypothetical protein
MNDGIKEEEEEKRLVALCKLATSRFASRFAGVARAPSNLGS